MFAAAQIDAIAAVAEFLALHEHGRPAEDGGLLPPPGPFDLILLFGNAVLATAEAAFRLMREDGAARLLISGGIGHSTRYLADAIASHPEYRGLATSGRPEADVLAELGRACFDLPPDRILVENRSTNCGENAAFSRRSIDEAGIDARAILLVQDPLMQRRTDATMRATFADRAGVAFRNWPVFVPKVARSDAVFELDGMAADGWSGPRFLALLLGEIPRLRDDADGYGPDGRGFIARVDIPSNVEAAFRQLTPLATAFGTRAVPPR
jgi:hypothetical protein